MNLREPSVCKIKKYKFEFMGSGKKTTVACLGDWHISPIVSSRQAKLIQESLGKIKPELILLQGDLIDSPSLLRDEKLKAQLIDTMKICSEMAPTLMVLGNHDYIEPVHRKIESKEAFQKLVMEKPLETWRKICQEAGVKLLADEWFETETVAVFGFFENEKMLFNKAAWHENFEEMQKRIRELKQNGKLETKPKKVNWFFSHVPIGQVAEMKELEGFKVMSFGHTHGGCVPRGLDTAFDKIGFTGGLIAPSKRLFPLKQIRGCETTKNGAKIIVNTGMILAQACAPKLFQELNFLKAGEVSEIEIRFLAHHQGK